MNAWRASCLVLVPFVLFVPALCSAQQPECPNTRTITQTGGPLGNGSSVTINVTLQPCETAVVTVSASTQLQNGSSAAAYFYNLSNQEFFS